jgi:hypothetical protein
VTAAGRVHALTADGALTLEIDPMLAPLVAHWLPVSFAAAGHPASHRAVISIVTASGAASPLPDGAATLSLGAARAWVDEPEQRVRLVGDGGVSGVVWLSRLQATLAIPVQSDAAPPSTLYYLLTITAALLLGRMGRALVHAGAVVRPDGGAWLVIGDARAGKTTTCVNLIAAGWDYLSDDQVILSPGDAGESIIDAQGWLRRFHLDRGWPRGVSIGDRDDFDPATLGGGRWRRQAPLEGLLATRVESGQVTELTPLTEAEALTALIRQSPWLLADRERAGPGLAFLTRVVGRPRFALRLGQDTYRDRDRLLSVLEQAVEQAVRR